MDNKQATLELGTKPVGKLLAQYALPAIVAMTASSLYNMIDSIFIGQGVGPLAISGLAITFPLMNLSAAFGAAVGIGSSTCISVKLGQKDYAMAEHIFGNSFTLNLVVGILFGLIAILFLDPILYFFGASENTIPYARDYMLVILAGNVVSQTFLGMNAVLRAASKPRQAMAATILTVILNIVLAPIFIWPLKLGIQGAAIATIISQYFAGFGLMILTLVKNKNLIPSFLEIAKWRKELRRVLSYSLLTSAQQSVMNFGILMIQGLVNSFGVSVMAAFAAGVKIDSFAYLPTQDFGNAYSFFISQNSGKGMRERIMKGTRSAILISTLFSLFISFLVNLTAPWLIGIFFSSPSDEILSIGISYLRVEGTFYALIGILFLFYGYFRADGRPSVSLVLTIISLGLRVLLAYAFAPLFGYMAIWAAIPIGWAVADLAALIFYKRNLRKMKENKSFDN